MILSLCRVQLADDATLSEELRNAHIKNGELEVRLKLLRDEVEDLRYVQIL